MSPSQWGAWPCEGLGRSRSPVVLGPLAAGCRVGERMVVGAHAWGDGAWSPKHAIAELGIVLAMSVHKLVGTRRPDLLLVGVACTGNGRCDRAERQRAVVDGSGVGPGRLAGQGRAVGGSVPLTVAPLDCGGERLQGAWTHPCLRVPLVMSIYLCSTCSSHPGAGPGSWPNACVSVGLHVVSCCMLFGRFMRQKVLA